MKKYCLILIFVLLITQQTYAESKENSPVPNYMKKHECSSPERLQFNNCYCPEGFYDDGNNSTCQICPYPSLYCDVDNLKNFLTCSDRVYLPLQFLLDDKMISEMQDFLLNDLKIFGQKDSDLESYYIKYNQVHAQYLRLVDKVNWKKNYNWNTERYYVGNEYFWRKNDLYYNKARKLSKFIEDLGIFEYTGDIVILINKPGKQGVRHFDHMLDLVCEFIWFRFDDNKQFNIEDDQGVQNYIRNNIIFFDDKRYHNIGTIDEASYSIRANGKFRPWFRKYIADNFQFDNQERKQRLLDQDQQFQPYPYLDTKYTYYNKTDVVRIEKEYGAWRQQFKNDIRGV